VRIVAVQKEAQEGSDHHHITHCSLTSYNTSELLPLTVHILLAQGKCKVMQRSSQGKSTSSQIALYFSIRKSTCMGNCCSSTDTFQLVD